MKKKFKFHVDARRSSVSYGAEHCGQDMIISPGRAKHWNDSPENLTCLVCGRRYRLNYHNFTMPKITQRIEIEENDFVTKKQIESLKRRLEKAEEDEEDDE